MARSHRWIGGSQRSPAALRTVAALMVFFFVATLPNLAHGSPPETPSPAEPTDPATPEKAAPSAEMAQPPADEALEDILRERATSSMEANELTESRAALLALQALGPSIPGVCNLGLIARRLALWLDAAENLSRCVRALVAIPPASQDRRRINEFRAELAMTRPMIASVRIRAPSGEPVLIDGKAVGTVTPDREIFLMPGPHTIVVGGRHKQIDLEAGDTATLDFILFVPERPKPRSFDWVNFAGWGGSVMFMSMGAGLLGVSTILERSAETKLSTLMASDARACSSGGRNPNECAALTRETSTANIFYAVSLGSFAISGVLLIGSVIHTTSEKPLRARVLIGLGSAGLEASW